MRRIITVIVEVESEAEDLTVVAETLIGYIAEAQEYSVTRVEDDEIGNEREVFSCELSVASAEACGVKIEAGWAVQ